MTIDRSSPLLGPLGLSEVEELIYRSLLRWSGGTRIDVMRTTGVAERAARAALGSLEDKGLLTRSTRRAEVYVPAPPEAAINILILRRQEELERVRVGVQLLTAEAGSEAPSGTPTEVVEVLERGEGVPIRNYQLLMGARREILGFSVPPTEPPDDQFIKFKLDILSRGVKARVVYTPEVLEEPESLRFIEALRPAGEEPRMAAQLPMPLLIVDRRFGFVPLHPERRGITHDHLVVHRSSLLESLVALFESVWDRAVPFEPGAQPPEVANVDDKPRLSPDEQRVLALLGAGMQDASIAHQLGIGPRTAQRHVRQIMDLLGTRTRFQTGMEACRQGLLGHSHPTGEPGGHHQPDEEIGCDRASAGMVRAPSST